MLPLLGPAGGHVAHLATTLLPCLAVHVALLVQPHIPLVTLHPMLGQFELRKPSVYMGTGARWYSILWEALRVGHEQQFDESGVIARRMNADRDWPRNHDICRLFR